MHLLEALTLCPGGVEREEKREVGLGRAKATPPQGVVPHTVLSPRTRDSKFKHGFPNVLEYLSVQGGG